MVHRLIIFAVLLENLCLVPSTYGSQFSVAPVRKVLMASCGLHEHQAHMCYADIYCICMCVYI